MIEHPIGFLVKVRLIEVKEEEISKGGIFIPGTTKKQRQMTSDIAVVESIGNLVFTDLPDKSETFKVGDIVRVVKFSGENLESSDGMFRRLLRFEDILARIELEEGESEESIIK